MVNLADVPIYSDGSTQPFFVLALPRSRTAWLSRFLSYPPERCGHDLIVECDCVADFEREMQRYTGTVETGVVDAWERLVRHWPQARYVAIQRQPDEVGASLTKQNVAWETGLLRARAEKLREFSSLRFVRSYSFADLDREEVCREIFEFCLMRPFDPMWWESLRGQNIQINLQQRMARLAERRSQLQRLRMESACV